MNYSRMLELAGITEAKSSYGTKIRKHGATKFEMGVHDGILDIAINVLDELKKFELNPSIANALDTSDRKKLKDFKDFIDHLAAPKSLIKLKEDK